MKPISPIFNQFEARKLASLSPRKRHATILHKQGAVFNKVFNYILKDSYMQPHCHPGCEKIEHITICKGEASVVFFDHNGAIISNVFLNSQNHTIAIPAFSWHTYVMHSEYVITYETMLGIYNPSNWKQLADWAPSEQSIDAKIYLKKIRDLIC